MSGDFFREANYGLLSATFRQACIDADTRSNKHSNGRNSTSLFAGRAKITVGHDQREQREAEKHRFHLARASQPRASTLLRGRRGLGKSQLLVAITAAHHRWCMAMRRGASPNSQRNYPLS